MLEPPGFGASGGFEASAFTSETSTSIKVRPNLAKYVGCVVPYPHHPKALSKLSISIGLKSRNGAVRARVLTVAPTASNPFRIQILRKACTSLAQSWRKPYGYEYAVRGRTFQPPARSREWAGRGRTFQPPARSREWAGRGRRFQPPARSREWAGRGLRFQPPARSRGNGRDAVLDSNRQPDRAGMGGTRS